MDIPELVATACPLVGDLGWSYYFTKATVARGEELGLDAVTFYFLGRGGVLGDVEPSVVHSAFGYFNPELLSSMWETGRRVVAPRAAAEAFLDCAARHGRRHLEGLAGLDSLCRSLEAVDGAAAPEALTLYAAASSFPLVEDPAGRVMQLVSRLREFRGSAHLLALRAVGLDSARAHHVKRPADGELFGWSAAEAPVVGEDDRRRWAEAEALTDRIVTPAYAVLDGAGADALVDGLRAVQAALAR